MGSKGQFGASMLLQASAATGIAAAVDAVADCGQKSLKGLTWLHLVSPAILQVLLSLLRLVPMLPLQYLLRRFIPASLLLQERQHSRAPTKTSI